MKRLGCMLAGMTLLWAGAAPLNAMNEQPASMPTSRLWRLAAQEQAMLEKRGIVLQNASLSSYLQVVAERLWAQVHTDLDTPTVRVIKDPRLEAYAYPNGYCFLTTGLISQMENEDQLAMVIAHEMVHYFRQHSAALYDHFKKSMPGIGLAYADQNPAAGGKLLKQQVEAAEYQADDEGLSMLKAAGYCEAEVLKLMSNLIDSLEGQGAAEAVEGLRIRLLTMTGLVGRSGEGTTCTSSTGNGHERFHDRIAPALMANAQAALQHGDWNQADRSISRLLSLKTDAASAYYLEGELLRRRNDDHGNNECIGSYTKALKIDPEFPLAHRALGELHFKAGRLLAAKPHFEAFLSLAPQDEAREFIQGYLRQCQH